ncbi:MAG: protein translocase subunit SecD [Planctomycetota bacterium]|nr:protein translocase subunit SecD [Planctomycetota bacterium]MDA1200418.1 protein translocase subunit SecD [Planctomycetota bacterium]
MNIPAFAVPLLAQATADGAAVANEASSSQIPGLGWLIALAILIIPTLLAWLVTKNLRVPDMWGRLATVLVALAAGGAICWLGWPPRLGIDLKGGLILVYEVAAGRQAQSRVDDCIVGIERILANQDGGEAALERDGPRRVTVRLAAADAAAREAFLAAMKKASFDGVTVTETSRRDEQGALAISYDITARAAKVPMDELVAAVSRRVNPGGQKEVTVRPFGLDQIEVILPEVEQGEVEQLKRIISSAGLLEFRILANRADGRPQHRDAIRLGEGSRARTVQKEGREIGRWVRLADEKVQPEPGMVTRPGPGEGTEVLVLVEEEKRTVTGGDLSRVSPDLDDASLQPCVSFMLTSDGSRKFGLLTKRNLPDPANGVTSRLGIVLDDVLQSAPVIRSQITSMGQITGRFEQDDVDFLVEVLNAGSLPAALESEPISEQQISAQLGEDTIRSAGRAMLLATVLVLTFMLAYYRFSGIVADLAVLMNIVLVVAVMISFKVAFTLAGLAGLVLSVGMAVDANVLIYERIREELDRGTAVRMAIRNGFQRAFSTIIDSNLTTLLTGVVLFAIGTDQLKGFAITLILGLVLNLFTAVFCSRVVFDLAERSRWLRHLSMGRLLGRTSYQFVRWARVAAVVSLGIIAAGVVATVQRGEEMLGIDFTGGTSIQVAFKEGQELPIAEIRRLVGENLESATVSAVADEDGGPDRQFKIDTSNQDEAEVEAILRQTFPKRLATYGVTVGTISTTSPPDARGEEGGDDGNENAASAVSTTGSQLPTSVPLTFAEPIARPALAAIIETAMAAEKLDGEFALQPPTDVADEPEAAATIWALATSLDAEAAGRLAERMATTLSETPLYLSANRIGGKVADNTRVTAAYALITSLALIVLYIWVRFQNVAFGLAAVVALAHDVLIALGCLAASRFVAPFMGWAQVDEFRISLDVVAALLTIVGFSINDTIVIFDRLREIRGKAKFVTADMVDRAVNQTLSRTILTSGTSLLAVLLLYAVGGPGIHAFAFTMLVGVITGTYSSIFVAAPLVLWLQHRFGAAAASERAIAQPA